jgi:hypothetical protein
LPVENVSQIGFKRLLLQQGHSTNSVFIANTDIFIGADGGMMHLASASKHQPLAYFRSLL